MVLKLMKMNILCDLVGAEVQTKEQLAIICVMGGKTLVTGLSVLCLIKDSLLFRNLEFILNKYVEYLMLY